jgi:hypothetical protein
MNFQTDGAALVLRAATRNLRLAGISGSHVAASGADVLASGHQAVAGLVSAA